MSAYLDASVLVSFLLEERASDDVIETLSRRTDAAIIVSDFAAAEVSSAISLRVRRGDDTPDAARARLSAFDLWRSELTMSVEIEPEDVRAADGIVRMFDLGLRAPDALHATVARRLDASLFTFDRQLARAAAALGIELMQPVPHMDKQV